MRISTVLFLAAVACGQEPDQAYVPERLLALSDPQIDELIQRAVDERVPPRAADALAILLMNREESVLPKLLARLRATLSDPERPGELLMKLEELLAYSPSIRTVDAFLANETQYRRPADRLLPMTLSNGIRRGSSMALAYWVLERGSDDARRAVLQWVRENAARPAVSRMWAKTLVGRNRETATSTFAADPLVQVLDAEARSRLERELLVQLNANAPAAK